MLAAPLLSQDSPLELGARLRISRTGRSVLVGTLLRRSPDSLWMSLPGQGPATAVALSGSTIEVSRGRRSHAGTGALAGVGVGALVAAAFLTAFCGGDNACDGDEQVKASLLFGVPSVALGAGIGLLIRTERWARVDPSLALGGTGRILLGVRIPVALR